MWTNVISVDKAYGNGFSYIAGEVEKIAELSTATEESRSRNFIYLAGLCDYADGIRARIEDVLVGAFFDYYKLRYFEKRLSAAKYTHAVCALIATLVYTDYEYERKYIERKMSELSGYDLDGLYHFRLRALRAGWRETSSMCAELLDAGADDADIYSVLSYLTANSENREVVLELSGGCLRDGFSKKPISIKNLFNDAEYDLLYAVAASRCTKLICCDDLSEKSAAALRHLTKLGYK